MSPVRLYFQLHLLVVLLAGTAILGRLILDPLSAAGLVVWRTVFACLGALAWVGLVWRKPACGPGE